MGFFKKIFNNVSNQLARNFADEVVRNTINNGNQQQSQNTQRPAPSNSVPVQPSPAAAPSGFSWGSVMPEEENQFNYNGSYFDYFNGIFRSEFPDYEIKVANGPYTKMPNFAFFKNGRCALVVELMSEKSSAKKLREDCRKAGIPYLRYYFDHEGWWNTKKYVIQRTRIALG